MDEERVRVECVKDWDESFAVSLTGFIADLQKILAAVPAEFRGNVIIEFDRYGNDYDTSRGELTIHYRRPWTADEIAQEERWKEVERRDREARERSELRRLKQKYDATA